MTALERSEMQHHVEIGARMLASARSPVLRLAGEIACSHHERWDGAGYLRGLAGDLIPISGRITAVADVYDALTHERPYKSAWDPAAAVAEVSAQSGKHFDPAVVSAFLAIDLNTIAALACAEPANSDSISCR